MLRRIAIVESHHDVSLVALLRIQHSAALFLIDDHRLLCDYVDASIQSGGDVLTVKTIHCRHHQQIGLRLITHLIEICERWTLHLHNLSRGSNSFWIDVTKSNELDHVRILLGKLASPHPTGPIASAHNRVTPSWRTDWSEARILQHQRRGRSGAGSLHKISARYIVWFWHRALRYRLELWLIAFATSTA